MKSKKHILLIMALIIACVLVAGTTPAASKNKWDAYATMAIVHLGDHADINSVVARNNAYLVQALSDGQTFLIQSADGTALDQFIKQCNKDKDVVYAEADTPLAIPETASTQSGQLAQSTVALLNQSTVALLNDSSSGFCTAGGLEENYFGAIVRSTFVHQPALNLIRNDQAHGLSTGTGIVVADIDNGVDVDSPFLQVALLPGYNFVDNNSDVSEWSALGQSTVALLNHNGSLGLDQSTVSLINQSTVSLLNQSTVSLLNQSTVSLLNQSTVSLLNQSTVALLNQSTVALLNQSTVSLLNQSTVSLLNNLPPAFGHGTMVAGLIRAVAPNAKIMPIKAFDENGAGDLFAVVSAIYYAVDNGADVINMSFSFADGSQTLKQATNYANHNHVALVASIGNDGVSANDNSFPADNPNVTAVAATDNNDTLAPFSNYGHKVDFTAPGVNLCTIAPGGHYALVSGTSFSSALVSGLVALADSARASNPDHIKGAMGQAAVNIDKLNPGYKNDLGKGRVDEPGTLNQIMK
ncbi:MAG: S8 family serine peptidase [Acidobacteriia bacterium]|nr:S8 family serine peptidase [Terriglobia bacterium]